MGPFFKQAVDQGEKNLHIVNPNYVEQHKAKLELAGIDTHHCEACGQLEVVPWERAYLNEDGVFDKDQMLITLDHLTGQGRDESFPRLRIMGNMDWAIADHPGAEQLIEFEAAVNELLERNRQPAVCVYDISKLSGGMMMDLLRTHPLTLIGGVVQENPFYTLPADMLDELRARKTGAAALKAAD